MMKLLLLVSVVITAAVSTEIPCNNWQSSTSVIGQHHFKIEVNADDWKEQGDPIRVTLKTKDKINHPIHGFLIQAHNIQEQPVGTFQLVRSNHRLHNCVNALDSVIHGSNMAPTSEVVVDWIPPNSYNPVEVPNGEIDFNAAVITIHNQAETLMNGIRTHTLHHNEATEPVVDTADHDAMVKESFDKETQAMLDNEEKMREEIAKEDQESEGDWVRAEQEELEKEEQERNDEMMKYEADMAAEEARRQHMIQLEIKDKEEHDKLMAEQEKNREKGETEENKFTENDNDDDDDDEIVLVGDKNNNVVSDINGVGRIVYSVSAIFLSVLAMLF